MFIGEDGLRLHLELERPQGACPLLILVHGFTGHMEERHILAVAAAARRARCAVLRAELYGHGQSGGAFRDHTLYRWLTNLLTVVDWARGQDFVRGIWLCGHSQGGLAVMLAAAMERDRIRGILPLSPACCIPEDARRGVFLGQRFDPERIPDELTLPDGQKLGGNYLRVAQAIDAETAIRRYDGPVLLVHGDADETIPFGSGAAAARAYADCTFVPIGGDTHCYDHHLDEVCAAVEGWLTEQRRP